ncbi:hypothetical protein POTOM_011570 [Populus tomentosa]|uniref:glyoxylate reductase (NADP(+)) n=1 Tax=Populus tomentosa TaxID=118781 RepID=A0A8X8AD50_POPTO|nr:hypothetical protein POTOM_011570 [Populus tomentosa]
MESIGVLMTCPPPDPYLVEQLEKRFTLFKFHSIPDKAHFLNSNKASIRAVVGNASAGADAQLIHQLPNLEIVSSFSVGLDKIDLAKCRERGIRVTNTPDVLTDDVADLAIGLMLAVLRRLCQSDRYVRSVNSCMEGRLVSSSLAVPPFLQIDYYFLQVCVFVLLNIDEVITTLGYISKVNPDCSASLGTLGLRNGAKFAFSKSSWLNVRFLLVLSISNLLLVVSLPCLANVSFPLKSTCRPFTGKSVGIIGLGRIGLAIAKRAEAFSCPISYHTRTEKSDVKYKYYPSVVELAANCQILIVACALTEETRHIINREVINALGPKGVLINIGRGPHVDEPELVSALVEGRLGGAGLDVFQDEPNVPEELFGLENVVLLPHVGSGTMETRKEMADLVVGNLEAHFLNKPLLTPVL